MPEPEAWGRSFTEATNEDAEIGAHGKYYSCSFLWDMEDRKVLVDMHKGKVERPTSIRSRSTPTSSRCAPRPRPGAAWVRRRRSRCSTESGRRRSQGDMSLEGDLLVLMQNLRCFTRQLELLRDTGVPV